MAAGATYEPIATTNLGSDTATITFSTISGSYTDIVLVMSCKNNTSDQGTILRVNGDTGNNYSRTVILGSGSAVFVGKSGNQSYIDAMYMSTNFSTAIVNIQNYSNATTNKTFLCRAGGGEINEVMGLWRNTAAITSVSLTPISGSYATGSMFTLYGIASA